MIKRIIKQALEARPGLRGRASPPRGLRGKRPASHRTQGVARGRALIANEARLPSSVTAYTIVVMEVGCRCSGTYFGSVGRLAMARPPSPPGSRADMGCGGTALTPAPGSTATAPFMPGNRAARRWEAMTLQERWVQATPKQMLDISLHAERGPMVLDDLRALPDSPLVVAEGSTLPAQAVSSGIADRSRAVWLLPQPTSSGRCLVLGARRRARRRSTACSRRRSPARPASMARRR